MMTTKRDYYEILGVSKSAGVDEIKRAYRKLAMQFHPDRVPEDKKKEAEERFKEISEAYAVLSDSKKRQLYDTYGHSGIDSQFSTEDIFRGANFGDIFGGLGGTSIFEDFFSDLGFDLFGRGGRSHSSRRGRGQDLAAEVSVSLEDVFSGAEKKVSFYRYETCPECRGEGAKPGTKKIICPACKGKGQVFNSLGFVRFGQTCPSCKGEGKIITHPCPKCSGKGVVKAKRTLKVRIPAGINDGSSLRIRGEGSSTGGLSGDLYVNVRVRPHPLFVRDGNNVILNSKVSLIKAVLGGEIEVPTLSGKVKMSIPEGTQPESVFRLKGKGLVDLRSQRKGDQFVKVQVEIPKHLSSKEKALFKEIARVRGDGLQAQGFTEKIKNAFR